MAKVTVINGRIEVEKDDGTLIGSIYVIEGEESAASELLDFYVAAADAPPVVVPKVVSDLSVLNKIASKHTNIKPPVKKKAPAKKAAATKAAAAKTSQ